MTALLAVEGLRCGYDGREVLRGVSFSVAEGDRVALLGPNGSGKTTLLRAIARALEPDAGALRLAGRDLAAYGARERSRLVAAVPSETATPFAFTVREFVSIGRTPHLGWFGRPGEEDERAVEEALRATETEAFAHRPVTTLSSGERQRVFLAQALAQEPRLLLLDEPTAHLDLSHEVELFDLLSAGSRERGLAWIAVLHDWNLAAEYAARLLVLHDGRIVADGAPESVVREEVLRRVFGGGFLVDRNPATGAPNVRLVPRERAAARRGEQRSESAGDARG